MKSLGFFGFKMYKSLQLLFLENAPPKNVRDILTTNLGPNLFSNLIFFKENEKKERKIIINTIAED